MKITIKNYTKNTDNIAVEYLVEREKETYNNIVENVVLSNLETQGLSENEIKTLGFKRIKPIAIRVFEQIEPLAEEDNPVDFELVASVPKRLDINSASVLTIGQTFEYNAIVYDQYNSPMETETTWTNKVINATEIGIIKVTASVGSITNSIDVSVVERIKTKEELQQEEIIQLKLALAEQSEKALQDKAELQLALAEIAETMGGV